VRPFSQLTQIEPHSLDRDFEECNNRDQDSVQLEELQCSEESMGVSHKDTFNKTFKFKLNRNKIIVSDYKKRASASKHDSSDKKSK